MSSSDFSSLKRFKTIKDLRKLKVKELKSLLESFGEPLGGKKEDLVLRCFVLVERSKLHTSTAKDSTATSSAATTSQDLASTADITYEKIIQEADGCTWEKDLRKLPQFTFVQLYDYLVNKTSKYNDLDVNSAGYKKLKAFNFFKEGHIKEMQLCEKNGLVYIKSEVLASMKSQRYKAVLVFDESSIVKAACKCPAGRGEKGFGRCNHIGGIIFAIEDFSRNDLQHIDEPISCTSRLCGWNVPRNMKVEPQPLESIAFKKIRYGKTTSSEAKITSYDPRAPSDRVVNNEALNALGNRLAHCLQSSGFFLFHGIQSNVPCAEIEIDSMNETIPDIVVEEPINSDTETEDMAFNDEYDISCKAFKEMVDCFIANVTITEEEINKIETVTRGQNRNEAWRSLKEIVLTASNFKKAAIRRKEPDSLLKDIMYINTLDSEKKKAASLSYGLQHEDDAVECYVLHHHAAGNINLTVAEVGTIVSRVFPGIGASLDRVVYDPSSTNGTKGGLEVKCPYSKRGMSLQEACGDKNFYLTLDNGHPILKRGHTYYYQVQGQMFACGLPWVDFVVWFDNDNIAVQRITFDSTWWEKEAMPPLMHFYKKAFMPEILTRRVKRGVPLYRHGGWLSHKQSKMRSS